MKKFSKKVFSLTILYALLVISMAAFGIVLAIGNNSNPSGDMFVQNVYYEVNIYTLGDNIERFNSDYASKIVSVRTSNNDYSITMEDAENLSKKIYNYAKKYDFTHKEGMVIINTESDFKKDAYNRKGKAYGLCQITQPCLSEYNKINGTEYELWQMFDVDLNLEVGFWYYNRLMNYYSNYVKYGIKTETREQAIADCYIAYNVGITTFKNVGHWGRNQLRVGYYPIDMYGSKSGESYIPITRFRKISTNWS